MPDREYLIIICKPIITTRAECKKWTVPNLKQKTTKKTKDAPKKPVQLDPESKPNRKRKRGKKDRADREGNSSDEGTLDKKSRVDSDDEEEQVTVYIHIHPPLLPSNKGKKPPPPKPLTKGPFICSMKQDFTSFKALIAKTIPCKPKLLLVNHMEWHYEKPANNTNKPLSAEAGYQALVKSLCKHKRDFVIWIVMPPPGKDNAVSHPKITIMQANTPCRHGIPTREITLKSLLITTRRVPCESHLNRIYQPKDRLYVMFAHPNTSPITFIGSHGGQFGISYRTAASEIPCWKLTTLP